jgi:hypothetical protein
VHKHCNQVVGLWFAVRQVCHDLLRRHCGPVAELHDHIAQLESDIRRLRIRIDAVDQDALNITETESFPSRVTSSRSFFGGPRLSLTRAHPRPEDPVEFVGVIFGAGFRRAALEPTAHGNFDELARRVRMLGMDALC